MKKLRVHLTYANVVSTIALALVVSGATAIAAGVGKNSVTNKAIKDGNVTARDLARIRVVNSGRGSAPPGIPRRAFCASNERLIGGGARGTGLTGAGVNLQSSYPDGNGWAVEQPGTGPGGNFEAYALCLKPKPGP